MKKVLPMLILMLALISLVQCGSDPSNDIKIGNKLYIPDGYESKLESLKLTEVAALPYFSSPFITVAKDKDGKQYAVLYYNSGEVRQEELPVKYEEMISLLDNKGYKIKEQGNVQNLHLFEINKKLIWNYGDGENKIYLDLKGDEINPFQK